MTLTVRRAGVDDLDALSRLFAAYRQFYQQVPDLSRARAFLSERLERDESVVFIALDGDEAVGFTQLYPSFSSVSAAPVLQLNDLYVEEAHRRRGAGRLLLTAAADYGRSVGAVRMWLTTQWNNTVAQTAYERLGWQPSNEFKTYNFAL